jgi:hypothetical protein
MGFTLPTRVQTSTLNAWLKEKEEPILRANPLMAMMRHRGLIKYKAGEIGKALNWDVPYIRRKLREIGGNTTDRAFVATNTKLHAQIDWTGYDMTEKISKLERLVNSNSATQISNLVKSTMLELMDDFGVDLGLKMWNDGTITGSGMYGVMSLHGASSTLSADECYNQLGSYTELSPVDANDWWNCQPTSARTYAGLSTTLGNKVNRWSGADDVAYPAGQFPEGYMFWTELIGNYNSTYFTPTGSSSTHSWDTQWQQAFNAIDTYQTKLMKEPVDTWILDADLMMRAKNSLIDNQRFVVSDSSEMRSLGFKDLEYNGWSLLTGYGVPDGMAQGFTWSKMELRLLQSQLVERTEDHDIRTSDDLFLLDSYHQMLFRSPRYFPCLVPATAAGT